MFSMLKTTLPAAGSTLPTSWMSSWLFSMQGLKFPCFWMPNQDSALVKVPNLLLLFAGAHTAFFFCRPLARVAGSASTYFKSFVNAYNYLSPAIERHPSLAAPQKKGTVQSTRS